MMSAAELETAKRLNLDLVVLIINDNGFGMIQWKQKTMGFLEFGLSYENPDFVRLAESFGATGYRLTRAEELSPLIEKCFVAKGVHVIDIPIDYTENDRVLNKELKEKTCEL